MRTILTCTLFLSLGGSFSFAQDCLNPVKYQEKMLAADSCIAAGNYSLAYDNYNAAAVYCRDSLSVINQQKDALFQQINSLRQENGKAVVANLIQQSTDELSDRTVAFRLLERAIRLDPSFPGLHEKLIEVAYLDERPWRIDQSYLTEDAIQSIFQKTATPNLKVTVSSVPPYRIAVLNEVGDTVFSTTTQTKYGEDFDLWALSENGQKMALISNSEFPPFAASLKVWDINQNQPILEQRIKGYISEVGFTQNGNFVGVSVSAYEDTEVILWQLGGNETPKVRPELEKWQFSTYDPNSSVYTYILNDQVYAFRSDNKASVYNVDFDPTFFRITKATVSPNGDLLFAALATTSPSRNKYLYVLDLKRNKQLFSKVTKGLTTMSFAPDGSSLMYANRNISVWNIIDQDTLIGSRAGPDGMGIFDAAIFSPNGKYIAAGGRAGELNIIDIGNPSMNNRLLKISVGWLSAVGFSADSKLAAAGSENGEIKIFDVESGALLFEYASEESIENGIREMAFSPDGRYLVTRSSGGGFADQLTHEIRIWDLRGQKLWVSFFTSDEINAISFTQTEPYQLLVRTKSEFKRYQLDPFNILEHLVNERKIGELTNGEKKYFNLNP